MLFGVWIGILRGVLPFCRRDRLEATGEGKRVSVVWRERTVWGKGGRGPSSLRLGLSRSRKELKDPDQLYTTLKNLLAQIKVGRPGSLLGVPMSKAVAF